MKPKKSGISKNEKKKPVVNGKNSAKASPKPALKAKVGKMGKEEAALREELALCYRVAHKYGLNEGCDNHFSLNLTVDGHDSMLTLPHGILWSTARAEDFILVDLKGNILRPSAREDNPLYGHTYLPDISAIKIHGKIHQGLGRKRAFAVFHTHQMYSSVLASAKPGSDELRQVHQNSCRFYNSVLNYREFNGVVDNDEEGINLTKQFKKKGNEEKRIMLMRNHGIITIGPTAAQAMMDLYYFERAAQVQVELEKMGQNLDECEMDLETAAGTFDYIKGERHRMSIAVMNAWAKGGI